MSKTEVYMQNYETVLITPLDLKEDDLTKIFDKFKDIVSKSGGEVSKLEKWGERDLAYPINDLTKGIYYVAEYTAGSNAVAEIENNFRYLRGEILRFLTVAVKPKKEKVIKVRPEKRASISNNEFSPPQSNIQEGGTE
jgi:small subunit ribosomal protein S6